MKMEYSSPLTTVTVLNYRCRLMQSLSHFGEGGAEGWVDDIDEEEG